MRCVFVIAAIAFTSTSHAHEYANNSQSFHSHSHHSAKRYSHPNDSSTGIQDAADTRTERTIRMMWEKSVGKWYGQRRKSAIYRLGARCTNEPPKIWPRRRSDEQMPHDEMIFEIQLRDAVRRFRWIMNLSGARCTYPPSTHQRKPIKTAKWEYVNANKRTEASVDFHAPNHWFQLSIRFSPPTVHRWCVFAVVLIE